MTMMAKRTFFLVVIIAAICAAEKSDCGSFIDLPNIFFETHTYATAQMNQRSSCQEMCATDTQCKAYAWSATPVTLEGECTRAARPCCYLKDVGAENLTTSTEVSTNFHSGYKPGCARNKHGYLDLSPYVYAYTIYFAARIGDCNTSVLSVSACQEQCLNTPACSLYSLDPYFRNSQEMHAGVNCENGKPCCYMYNVKNATAEHQWMDLGMPALWNANGYHSGLKFACDYTGAEGYIFHGDDMNVVSTGLDTCQTLCCEDPECKLYSWSKSGYNENGFWEPEKCHLKNRIPSNYTKTELGGYYSAIKSAAAKGFSFTETKPDNTPQITDNTPQVTDNSPQMKESSIPYITVRADVLGVLCAQAVLMIVGLAVMLYRAKRKNNNKPYVLVDNASFFKQNSRF